MVARSHLTDYSALILFLIIHMFSYQNYQEPGQVVFFKHRPMATVLHRFKYGFQLLVSCR